MTFDDDFKKQLLHMRISSEVGRARNVCMEFHLYMFSFSVILTLILTSWVLADLL